MKKMQWLWLIVVVLSLVACGGGGGSPGTVGSTPSGSGSGGSPAGGPGNEDRNATMATDFQFAFDKRYISNSGSDSAKLTVTALDSNNNVVAGVPIVVKVDTATFTQTAKVTDEKGKYSGIIEIGQDKSNRSVTVTISMGALRKSSTLSVIGTVITANLIPANPSPDQQVRLELAVKDSLGNAIAGAPVDISGTLVPSTTSNTNESGTISLSFQAPNSAGPYKLLANGMGATLARDVQVNSAQSIPSAQGVISSASLSVAPTVISPNTSGSTANRSSIKAKFLDTSEAGIKNIRVQFKITSNPISGEAISVGDGVVYTDDNGEATADYIPGSTSSANDGVEIKACYKSTDFLDTDLLNNCANLRGRNIGVTEGQKLTVAAEPVSIAISDYSKLEKGTSGIDYLDKLLIQVTDAAGQSVADAVVSAIVNITHYGKGVYGGDYDLGFMPPPANYASQDNVTPTANRRIWCSNEDVNRNAAIDLNEDKNSNGTLEPEQAAISLTYVDPKKKTDANGQMLIKLSYGQRFATWLAYTVTVTTKVKNSEGSTSMRFITSYTEDDKDKGTFHKPPYGTGRCDSPN